MFYEGLHFLKGLPSPEGVWEKVQVIGELIRIFECVSLIWFAGLLNVCTWRLLMQLLASRYFICMVVFVSTPKFLLLTWSLVLCIDIA